MTPVRAVALFAAAAASALVVVAAASADYGPVAPPGPPVPGGFSVVIASRTIGPGGGSLSATTGHAAVRLAVPAHALTRRVQFTITRPRLSGLRAATPKGQRLIVGFALLANDSNGRQIRGWFSRRPVVLTLSGRALTRTAQVFAWSPGRHRFVRYAAVIRAGKVVISTRHFGEFLVVSPR
jgi:hypothetical protein